MKALFVCTLALGLLPYWAEAQANSVKLKVRIPTTCAQDTLRLFIWQGTQISPIAEQFGSNKADVKEFVFQLKQVKEGIYYWGYNLQDLRMCYLGPEAELSFTAVCGQALSQTSQMQSPLNQAMNEQMALYQERNSRFVALLQQYQEFQGLRNEKGMDSIRAEMGALDRQKRETLESLKKQKSPLYRLAALNSYQSWHAQNRGEIEQDYIAQRLFEFVDFKDPVYAQLPFFPETARSYALTLASLAMAPDKQRRYYDSLLTLVPSSKHPNHTPLHLGIALGLMNKNNDLFLHYAQTFLKEHQGENPLLDQFLQEQIAKLRGPLPLGELAPEITAKSPQGQDLSLSSLRGKVVLIDFWASWCGPCRRENPFVVQLYERYKDKGFEIFGVSLDTDQNRWVSAIKQDNLTWPQVSDLGGWRAEPAQRYGVSSIPFTVLLDAEGRVIAKQLRGEQLANALKEIFGY